MIIVDTREKKWEHIKEYFERNNIEYEVKKLDIADYMDSTNEKLVIDRKHNLDECCQNLCSSDSNRFWREVRKSKEAKIKMIVLVEHSNRIKKIADVPNWKSKYSKVTGKRLAEEMYRVHIAYGVDWIFTDKRHTAQKIMELLHDNR